MEKTALGSHLDVTLGLMLHTGNSHTGTNLELPKEACAEYRVRIQHADHEETINK